MTVAHLVDCPTCQGTGKIPSDRELLTGGKWCPADLECGHMHLTCLIVGYHEGPHLGYEAPPCRACGAMDIHADWCPERDYVTDDGCDVAFDDDGWYWLPEPIDPPVAWPYGDDEAKARAHEFKS